MASGPSRSTRFLILHSTPQPPELLDRRRWRMDFQTFLVSLFVLVDDRVSGTHSREPKSKRGRPTLLSESDVLTLAILCQWPRFRSERDFWRFADTYLRSYFP